MCLYFRKPITSSRPRVPANYCIPSAAASPSTYGAANAGQDPASTPSINQTPSSTAAAHIYRGELVMYLFTSRVARPLVRNGGVYRGAQGQPGALSEVSPSCLALALISVAQPLVVVIIWLAAVLPRAPVINSSAATYQVYSKYNVEHTSRYYLSHRLGIVRATHKTRNR